MSARATEGLAFVLLAVPVALVSLRDCAREDRRGQVREGIAQVADLATSAAVAASQAGGRCPGGPAGPTPPLALDCNADPSQRCTPVDAPTSAPGRYWRGIWFADPTWRAIGAAPRRPHAFHYALTTADEAVPEDRCLFRARARGDLDGDGAFSTLELAGVADAAGARLDPRWRFVDPLE